MTHDHKYFLFETKSTFEPAAGYLYAPEDKEHKTLYERIEYSILACNCGDTIKRKIRQEDGGEG